MHSIRKNRGDTSAPFTPSLIRHHQTSTFSTQASVLPDPDARKGPPSPPRRRSRRRRTAPGAARARPRPRPARRTAATRDGRPGPRPCAARPPRPAGASATPSSGARYRRRARAGGGAVGCTPTTARASRGPRHARPHPSSRRPRGPSAAIAPASGSRTACGPTPWTLLSRHWAPSDRTISMGWRGTLAHLSKWLLLSPGRSTSVNRRYCDVPRFSRKTGRVKGRRKTGTWGGMEVDAPKNRASEPSGITLRGWGRVVSGPRRHLSPLRPRSSVLGTEKQSETYTTERPLATNR